MLTLNAMRLLDLNSQVQTWLTQNLLSVGHAKVLLALKSQEEQLAVAGTEDNRAQWTAIAGDFSRWLESVFRDCPLATHVRKIEGRVTAEPTRDVAADIAQSIRARYDTPANVPQ